MIAVDYSIKNNIAQNREKCLVYRILLLLFLFSHSFSFPPLVCYFCFFLSASLLSCLSFLQSIYPVVLILLPLTLSLPPYLSFSPLLLIFLSSLSISLTHFLTFLLPPVFLSYLLVPHISCFFLLHNFIISYPPSSFLLSFIISFSCSLSFPSFSLPFVFFLHSLLSPFPSSSIHYFLHSTLTIFSESLPHFLTS